MHEIEPILTNDPTTISLAQTVLDHARILGGSLHTATVKAVATLLRTVNCFYSNLIENHNTPPIAIEKAMRSEYAENSRERNLQKEARAHIEVQIEVEKRLEQEPGIAVVSAGRYSRKVNDRSHSADSNARRHR